MDSERFNLLIEEYKTLRSELLLHMKQSQQVLAWSGTIAVATVGLCLKAVDIIPKEYSGLILLAIITPITLVYKHECFVIGKIASYIQHRIEPVLVDLNWTTDNFLKPNPSGLRILDFRSSSIGSIYFSVLLAGSWIFPWSLTGKLPNTTSIIIMSIFSVIYAINVITLFCYKHYRNGWDKIWELAHSDLILSRVEANKKIQSTADRSG
jgi:hypothetical protein